MPSRLLQRLLASAIARRHVVAALVVLVVIIAGALSARLQIRNDLAAFFIDGDPAVVDYETFKDRFGTDEVVVIDIGGSDDAFSPARLRELTDLSTSLARLPGVARVMSLATVELVRSGDGESTIVPARLDVDEARRQSRPGGPLARLVDDGARHQRVWLWLAASATTDRGRHEALVAIEAAVAPLKAARTVRVVGGGVVWEALNALTIRDGAVFSSLAAVVLFAGLLWLTRRLLWAVVAVVAVSGANTVVLATMAITGTAMNAITVCLPSLVMALSVLDLVHLIVAIDDLPDDVDTVDDPRVVDALALVVTPGIFNILTTMVGLLALVTATSAVTRQLGAFAALGVALAWLSCLAWTIVALPRALRDRPRHPARERHVARLGRAAIARPWPIVGVAALVLAASLIGIARLDADTDTLGFLPASHPVHQDVRAIEASVGPFIPLEVDVAVVTPGGWQRADVMAALRQATAALAGLPVKTRIGDVQLGTPVSVLDVLEPADRALGGTALRTDDQVAAAVAFVQASAPQLFDGVVSSDQRHLRFTVPVTLTTAQGFIAASAQVRVVIDRALKDTGASVRSASATARLTGYLPLYARIVDALVDDQLRSFAVAFVGVFTLIGALLRSWRLMVLAAVPNLLPILGILGVMGICGIPLDVATITIAATILGVIVDDTVHTLFHLRRGLEQGLAPATAILEATRSTGRANAVGNGLLLAGFLVLTLASARSLVLVGGLSAVAIAFALLADLVVLPAVAVLVLRSARPGHSR
jgi:predicted RND superfamily exporter protein